MLTKNNQKTVEAAGIDYLENASFDDAIEMTKFGKFNFIFMACCSVICISFVLETLSFSFVLPASQCDFNLTITEKGWLGAIPFVGLAISSYFWGYLADTYGRKRILSISMAVGALFGFMSTFSPNKLIFGILRLVASAFFAASDSVIFPYFGEFMPKKYVDSLISVLISFLVSGFVYGSLIAWGILSFLDFRLHIPLLDIDFRPWRLLVLVYVFPFILSSILIHFFPESPKFLISVGKTEESLKILKQVYAMNTGLPQDTFRVKSIKSELDMEKLGSNQALMLFKMPYLKYVFLTCLGYFSIFYCASSFFLWLPEIGEAFNIGVNDPDSVGENFCHLLSVRGKINNSTEHEIIHCSDTLSLNAYMLTIWISLSTTIFTVFVSGILRVVSKKNILITVFALSSFTSLILHWVYEPSVMWIMLGITQFVGSTTGVLNAYAVEIYPTNLRSMGICVMGIMGRIGSVVGTNITGILINNSCPLNFFLFGLVLAVACICSLFLPVKKKVEDESLRIN